MGCLLTVAIVIQFIRARSGPAASACLNNLRQIDGAKQTWALENRSKPGDVIRWSQIQPYMGRGTAGSLPTCPEGGIYILGRVDEPPKCSIGGVRHSLE